MRVFQATVGNRAYPPDTGGYQRTNGLALSFPTHGDSVRRYCCTGPIATYYADGELIDSEARVEPDLIEKRHYSLLHDVPKFLRLVGYPAFLWPVVFRTWSGTNLVESAAGNDVAIADNPYLALFLAENTELPTIYSSHNIEYQRYASEADGPFSEYFGDRLREVEQQAARTVDLVLCTTESDREEFASYARSTAVIPNGVASDRMQGEIQPADREEYGIPSDAIIGVFLGSDHGPNIEAAEWLATNWASLDSEYHLLVIGDAGRSVDGTAENIHVTGYVENLQASLAMADIALNPIFSGGGSNVKLIEYFAAVLPVVSTPFGARGFDVRDGDHLLVADRDEFLDAVHRLGDYPHLQDRLGTNAHQLAAERYTWESLSEQFREVVLDVCSASGEEEHTATPIGSQ